MEHCPCVELQTSGCANGGLFKQCPLTSTLRWAAWKGDLMPQKHHEALRDSYKLVQEAHANYERTIATATDTGLSPDGFFAIRQSGRAYAEAVMRYSHAAMSFLALMEADQAGAIKALRNGRAKALVH